MLLQQLKRSYTLEVLHHKGYELFIKEDIPNNCIQFSMRKGNITTEVDTIPLDENYELALQKIELHKEIIDNTESRNINATQPNNFDKVSKNHVMKNTLIKCADRSSMINHIDSWIKDQDIYISNITNFFDVASDSYYISVCYLDDPED